MNIGIYIYDYAEVLDFSGPYEAFSTASRIESESLIQIAAIKSTKLTRLMASETASPFNPILIAEQESAVRARSGFKVLPHYTIKNHPKLDVLIVVGGIHDNEMSNQTVINWIKAQAEQVEILATVCTGVFIVAQAGCLGDHKVTTHWHDIDQLQNEFPDLKVIGNHRWVDEGKLVTSGGISAGIDMSLHLIARLHNKELAIRTAKEMDYQWQDSD
ncbi:glutamine amidotransferase [Saccharobesus litoralis]|uniref:Glutamine amidotransferase n=1 Tax=Saccharobesus litoralis TaxID=2172099 RepID=A0A2S0VM12_9ALTE|nr:DJ-1/PfpI family protein [Saccharobesus litoralis]AWB65254.1 glutamine amidotransferase [Saccharobesus litoralis]